MFLSMSGSRARYHDLTLLVISEFNEWKVLVHGGDATIVGVRQFSEDKAREHALTLASAYLRERKHEQLPETGSVEWTPTRPDDWLVWC